MKTSVSWTTVLLTALASAQRPQPQNQQQPITLSTRPSSIPLIGFGTWNLDKSNASEAVSVSLQTGYQHIDCAAVYGNEREVGRGIHDGLKNSEQRREDIWVTSKLWNDHHDPDKVEEALDKTLRDLGLPYLDLYLMHWPVASKSGKNYISYLDTWQAMESLVATGKVLRIGVSNFDPSQLSHLLEHATIKPAVHQMELHPYLQQHDFLQYHKDLGIAVTAYSPLANLNPIYDSPSAPPSLLQNEQISKIAKKRGCTNAQVALQWGMQRGTNVIPKSQHADRIVENFEAMGCDLHEVDYVVIEEVGKRYLKRFNNPSDGWGVKLYKGLEDGNPKE